MAMAAALTLPPLPNLRLPQIQPKLISTSSSHTPPPHSLHRFASASLPLTALTLPFFLHPQDALAVGGEFGILEGRSFALIHPIVMGGLFVYTLYAGYLGWQWRRVRTIQDEINELKKQIKPVAVTPAGSPPAESSAPSPVEAKIEQLTQERKELIKGSYRDKHFNAGSILLGFGVFESVFGGLNTWFRTGKLFPGPHLFAGAANRAPAPPPPAPAPAPPPAPAPVRPSLPIRPTLTQQPPPQPQQPAPPPPRSPPPAPAPTPPQSPPKPPVTSPQPTTTPAPTITSPVTVAVPQPSPPEPPVTQPPPTTVPAPAPAPPAVPIRPSVAPVVIPARPSVAPPVSATAPPRAPVVVPARPSVAPPVSAAAPTRAPVASSPTTAPAPAPVPPAVPIRPSVAPSESATAPRAPVAPPPTAAPPPRSPTRTPPPPNKSPQTSPVQKQVLTPKNSPPQSPKTKSPSPPTPPKPLATTEVTANSKPPSPKVIKPLERAPPESPKSKPLPHPPSPLTLPPARSNSDTEQRTVREDKIIEKTVQMGRGRSNGSSPKDRGMIKKLSDSEDKQGLGVITLAGENKGAIMEVKPWLQNGKQTSNREEGKSRDKNKDKGGMTVQSPMGGYFNSNVQGLNNSIIYDGSIRNNDPGIHLSFTRKLNSTPTQSP